MAGKWLGRWEVAGKVGRGGREEGEVSTNDKHKPLRRRPRKRDSMRFHTMYDGRSEITVEDRGDVDEVEGDAEGEQAGY